MKFLLIINSVLMAVVAQRPSLSCVYQLSGETYRCYLTVNNPEGLNNFTEIDGIHWGGFTNADVNSVNRISGVSPIVPSIICETFPNVNHLDFSFLRLIEIDDSAFSSCSRILTLNLFKNEISSISANAFASLFEMQMLYLSENLLTSLNENVFSNQRNMTRLAMGFNPIRSIPAGLFEPLENIETIELEVFEIDTLNFQWFASNKRLTRLTVEGSNISAFTENNVRLESLTSLNLGYNKITHIPTGPLSQLPNLQSLYLYGNNISELHADTLSVVGSLLTLDLSENPIDVIHEGAFRGLGNLTILAIEDATIRQLHSDSFEGLESLVYLYLSFNNIEDLPDGIFAPLPNLDAVGLQSNRLKTLRRNAFGNSLRNLRAIDLENNVVNSLDKKIIDEAVNLNTFYLRGNLCVNNNFGNFLINRDQFLPMLEICFSNMRYVVDTITEGDDEFSFFEAPPRGIAVRVRASSEVQIALTAFKFVWNPIVEILIGTANNSRSEIRIDQQTNVVTVPTPNIIKQEEWNDFRFAWANHVIHVYSGNDNFPFMSFTMQSFFPVNFYGLRTVETRASWSVQPFW